VGEVDVDEDLAEISNRRFQNSAIGATRADVGVSQQAEASEPGRRDDHVSPDRDPEELFREVRDDAQQPERGRLTGLEEGLECTPERRDAEFGVDGAAEASQHDLEQQGPDDQLESLELRHCEIFRGLRLDPAPVVRTLSVGHRRRSEKGMERREMQQQRLRLAAALIHQRVGQKPEVGREHRQKTPRQHRRHAPQRVRSRECEQTEIDAVLHEHRTTARGSGSVGRGGSLPPAA
jgi:hypothetical protein